MASGQGHPAARTEVGTAISNPLGEEPWVLDVVGVAGPDPEGMVTIFAVQGEVVVAGDWPCVPYTPQDAAFEAALLVQERRAESGGRTPTREH